MQTQIDKLPRARVAGNGFNTANVRTRFRLRCPGLLASLGCSALLMAAAPVMAQSVGAAQSFAIVGGSAITATAPLITINGDVGIAPAAATFITGFPANATIVAPFANHGNDASAIAARAAVTTLFSDPLLAPAGGVAITANMSTGGPTANGHYTPGHYTLAVGTAIIPTSITLDGAGTYIFSLNSDITTSVGSTVLFTGGANACNVFWLVPTLATLNGVNFPGTVVAGTGVHMGVGAGLTGRALAGPGGDVTMAGGNAVGGCSAAGAPAGLAATSLSTVASATVALGGSISDTATLTGGGVGAAAPTGTVTFRLFGPNDATCAGAVIFTSTPAVAGNGVYGSGSFVPAAAGTYRWIANYGGDGNNSPTANACNAAGEFVNVTAGGGGSIGAPGPTLSEWAMILLAAMLAFAGFTAIRKQSR